MDPRSPWPSSYLSAGKYYGFLSHSDQVVFKGNKTTAILHMAKNTYCTSTLPVTWSQNAHLEHSIPHLLNYISRPPSENFIMWSSAGSPSEFPVLPISGAKRGNNCKVKGSVRPKAKHFIYRCTKPALGFLCLGHSNKRMPHHAIDLSTLYSPPGRFRCSRSPSSFLTHPFTSSII